MNNYFCVMPWLSTMVDNTGILKHCCVAKNNENLLDMQSIEKSSIVEFFNSNYMKNIRKKMYFNIPEETCSTCYLNENLGKKSYRQYNNEIYLNEKFKKEILDISVDNDFFVEKYPSLLDIRIGNLCNLKCRMCSPENSSEIEKEILELKQKSNILKEMEKIGIRNDYKQNEWFNTKFWEELFFLIPYLEEVRITGGEPTLVEGNFKFLEKCIELGESNRIKIVMNTNGTNFNKKISECLSKFSDVTITVSIDGKDKIQEYIRSPSNWKKVENTFLLLQNIENLKISINTVIQVYNILNITELFEWGDNLNKKVNFEFMLLENPEYLNVGILPIEIKKEAINRINNYLENSYMYLNSQKFRRNIKFLKNYLLYSNNKNSKIHIENFFSYTQLLDDKRKESFKDSIPDLYFMLEKYQG